MKQVGALSRWATFGPALLVMLALGALPLANLVYTSFHTVTWSGGQATFSWAGLAHYRALPADPRLRAGFFHTIVFAVFAVASVIACCAAACVASAGLVWWWGCTLACSASTTGDF